MRSNQDYWIYEGQLVVVGTVNGEESQPALMEPALEGLQDQQAEKNKQLVKQGRWTLRFPSRCGFDRGKTILVEAAPLMYIAFS